jgi:hypothetical protein
MTIPDEVSLDIHAEKQQTLEWCWAACACGVARFLKIDKQPTESDLANTLTGRTDCSSSPVPKECVTGAQPEQIAAIYQSLGIARIGPDYPLSLQTLLSELIAGRPVEVGYLWYAGGGHVALVRGFQKWMSKFYVSDPWFGDGQLNYQEIAAGYGVGRWALSFGRFAKLEK